MSVSPANMDDETRRQARGSTDAPPSTDEQEVEVKTKEVAIWKMVQILIVF